MSGEQPVVRGVVEGVGPVVAGAHPRGVPPHAAVDGPERPVCSRRGCTAEAAWALEWNNPRVHAPDRVKTWLACTDHRPFLDDFLSARGFLRRSRPLDPAATQAPEVDTPETPQEPPRP